MKQERIQELVGQIVALAPEGGREIRLMEVCGTHTVSLFRSGVKGLLPGSVRLISGPGCPVCVTSQGYIDAACEIAGRSGVTICTYGDMVRVPGAKGSLEQMRGEGAEVKVVYSALDAVGMAESRPDREVVFLAVGFETTTPGTAGAVMEAASKGIDNFSILSGHKLVMPALEALLSAGDMAVDGFMCPGHVSIVIGTEAYRPIAERYGKACVVTGFEPEQMLEGIEQLVRQVIEGRSEVENAYGVAVRDKGNAHALRMIDEVFEPADVVWRALGTIPASGLELRERYRRFDAIERFGLTLGPDVEPVGCRCGEVIQGKIDPVECALFGKGCTPTKPVGPCMVSSEGTCAAWYKYRRPEVEGHA